MRGQSVNHSVSRKTSLLVAAGSAAVVVLAIQGCPLPKGGGGSATGRADGISQPISQLPVIDPGTATKVLGEQLVKPTALGETTALHVRLPPPLNPQLASSLLRVVGPANSPQLLFRSDALAQLGLIAKSPGPDFFTAFASLSNDQLALLQRNQQQISSGAFGKPTSESVVFAGRSPVGRSTFGPIDTSQINPGAGGIHLSVCALRPASTQADWDEALFIRDSAVVQDPARTWDPCTGAGTQGGVWTFAHLIREMANGSGKTPEAFVLDWLSLWLNDYTVNGDTVAARPQMFNQVIQPWAVASGGSATLTGPDAQGHRTLTVTGTLNLDIAPFRLLAIVNRIDLGDTVTGPSGYSGTVTSLPKTAGELRFIFDVVQPANGSCGQKLFTTIFEYGVPGSGCTTVVRWAQEWTSLLTLGGFTPAYLSQLQTMTESVVTHGAAPGKGNGNAIDQIRTNEIALAGPWELREFHLSDENFAAGTDTPSNGELRAHTVALSPNDGAFSAAGPDPTINNYVTSVVVPAVQTPVSNPDQCNASFQMPYLFNNEPLRGGNVLIGPGHWNVSTVTTASPPAQICARHQFSLNTCGGCHHDDAGTNGLNGSTNFTQVAATSNPPVALSKFLTGGGPGLSFGVADPQLGTPTWQFADLERRFQRLFDISHCTSCLRIIAFPPSLINFLRSLGPVPIDPGPDSGLLRDTLADIKIGPVTDISVLQKVIDGRGQFTSAGAPPVTADQTADFIRAITQQTD